jgi:hypothetical protein
VAIFGALAFAHRAGPPDLRITGKVSGTPTPTVERPDASGAPRAAGAFAASGSWTMSSLPDCFFEQERVRGGVAQLRGKFPPAAQRLAPGTVVRAGDCAIEVRDRELWISRGPDRLRVPPDARLYRHAGGLTLVVVDGGHAEIRRYSADAPGAAEPELPSSR